MDVADTGIHYVLILSTDLRKTRDVNSPGEVGAVITRVPYAVIGFAKFPAFSEGR